MLILTGSLAFDFILNFNGKFTDHILPDKIHTINLSFLAEKLSKEKGGIAGNIGYNLSLLGISPIILGSLGKNDGNDYLKHLKKNKINCDYINLIKDEFTASYIVVTDLLNNQIGSFYPGAMRSDKKRSLLEIFKDSSLPIKSGSNNKLHSSNGVRSFNNLVVISPGDPEAMKKFILECRENNLPYVFDPGKQLPYLSDKTLSLGINSCRILISNDYELALIEKRIKFQKVNLLKGNKILITTLGEKGSKITTFNKVYNVKSAKPKKVLDPVGAGDAYLGGFLAGLERNFDLQTCGEIGSVCAVYTVEKYGTQTHKFTPKELIKRYQKNYDKIIKL